MPVKRTKEALIQNLKDAGCSEKAIQSFLDCLESDHVEDGLKLLSEHRDKLLCYIHRSEKKMDCLDYLVYQLKRGKLHS